MKITLIILLITIINQYITVKADSSADEQTVDFTQEEFDLLQRYVQDEESAFNPPAPATQDDLGDYDFESLMEYYGLNENDNVPVEDSYLPSSVEVAEPSRRQANRPRTQKEIDEQCSEEQQDNEYSARNDVPARFKLKLIRDPKRKLQEMIKIHDEMLKDVRPLTIGASDFKFKGLQPAMDCLNCHFNGDEDKFIEYHRGRLTHTGFMKYQCTGKGDSCNLKTDQAGLNDIPARHNLADILDPKERLLKLIEIKESLPKTALKSGLTAGAYTFVLRILNPVLNCLDNHFDGDIDEFLDHHDMKVSYSNFKDTRCTGQGEKCSNIPDERSDLAERHELDDIIDPRKKLLSMIEMEKDLPYGLKYLRPTAKRFVVNQLRPVIRCLNNHFGGDIEKFLEHWNSFEQISNFKNLKCCGNGDHCHIEPIRPRKRKKHHNDL